MCNDTDKIDWDEIDVQPGWAHFLASKSMDRKLQARLAARHARYLQRQAEKAAAAARVSGPGDERGRVAEAAGDVGEEL